MLEMLTNWTTTTWGQVVVGVSVLGLGLAHFGKFSEWMQTSIPLAGSVGNVAGAVGVLVGLTMVLRDM